MIVEIKRRFWKIGFRFDALSVLLLCEQHSIELAELNKIDQKEYLFSWCWNAYRSWQIRRQRIPHITYAKMKKIIADMKYDDWLKVSATMLASQGPQGETDKKKAQDGMKSS